MKKKLLVMFVASMCVMLCACGSSNENNVENNTESTQNGSEVVNEEEKISLVGQWKDVRNVGGSYFIKEDGTYAASGSDGAEGNYEIDSDNNIVKLDRDFSIVCEDGTYKLLCVEADPDTAGDSIAHFACLVRTSDYDTCHEKYLNDLEAEKQSKLDQRIPTPIEKIYWLCTDGGDSSYGFYLDGRCNFIKVLSDGRILEGEHTIKEDIDGESEDGTMYSVVWDTKTIDGQPPFSSQMASWDIFTFTSAGTLTSNDVEYNSETSTSEKVLLTFKQVDEATFYNAFK